MNIQTADKDYSDAMCGAFLEHWDKDVKLYDTVSKAMHQDEGVPSFLHGPHIDPGTEAFVCLACENGMAGRFNRLIELRKVRT